MASLLASHRPLTIRICIKHNATYARSHCRRVVPYRIVSLSIRGCLSIYPSICLSITLHARIIIITTCAQPFTYARVFLRGFVLLSTSCTAQEGLDRASHAPRSYVSVNQVAPRRCNSIDRAAVLQNCDDDDERYTAASASNSSMMISNGIWYNNDAGSRV